MNSITGFRLCKLSNEELITRVDAFADNIYKDGRIPDRHIPARPDEDFDLLVGELLLRFRENEKKLNDVKDLTETCLSEDPDDGGLNQILTIINGENNGT